MKKTNHLLASLFSFFIAFFMFLGLFVTITKLTLMNENYLFNTLEKVDYYQAIANELNEDFMQSAGAAGGGYPARPPCRSIAAGCPPAPRREGRGSGQRGLHRSHAAPPA